MKTLLIAIITSLVFLAGCTENERAKQFGGTATLKPSNAEWRLVTLTWKANELWGLWYEPSTGKCYFKEDSSWGVMEGVVVIENCKPYAIQK